jgi:acyl carrier protein
VNDENILTLVKSALDSVAPDWNKDITELNLDVKMRDLAIDSVSTMEMVGYLEDELGVTFPDEDLAQVNKLGDLVGLVRSTAR